MEAIIISIIAILISLVAMGMNFIPRNQRFVRYRDIGAEANNDQTLISADKLSRAFYPGITQGIIGVYIVDDELIGSVGDTMWYLPGYQRFEVYPARDGREIINAGTIIEEGECNDGWRYYKILNEESRWRDWQRKPEPFKGKGYGNNDDLGRLR